MTTGTGKRICIKFARVKGGRRRCIKYREMPVGASSDWEADSPTHKRYICQRVLQTTKRGRRRTRVYRCRDRKKGAFVSGSYCKKNTPCYKNKP